MSDQDVAVDQDESLVEKEEELSEEQQAMAKLKEAITVEREELGALRLKLTITVPGDTIVERRGDQYAELKRDAAIPGFRKGHAPIALVEKRFASDVDEQLKSQLVSSGYLAAIEKEEIKPMGDPLLWVCVNEERVDENQVSTQVETKKLLPIEKALDEIEMPNEGPLTFSCEVELKPEFELPKLDKISIERPTFSVSDEDVDHELKRALMMRGTFQPVEGGKVELDDMLYADMTMSVGGSTIEHAENFDLAARDIRIQGVVLEGFGKAVKGKKVGDKVEFEATVPGDHENIDIRGKTASFEFVLREIKRLNIPPLDDEFLASIGFESKKELREAMRDTLESRLGATVQEAMREQVGRYLIDQTKLEIPEGLSQRQTERSVARSMIEMLQAGIPQAEIEKRLDEMRAKATEQVTRDLKLYFILEKIAEDHEVTVGEERINAAIAQMAQRSGKRFDRVRDELSQGDGLSMLYVQLRDQQVLDDLIEDAEIKDVEGPRKKASASPKSQKKKSTPKKAASKATVKKKSAKRST